MKFINACLLLSLLVSFSARAATVLQVKNGKTLIDLEGATLNEGDEFFLINPATTKKIAIVRIKQVKKGRAVAEILKGKAQPGSTLQAKASSSAKADESASHPMSADVAEDTTATLTRSYQKLLKNSWGLVGEYITTSMDATFSRTTPYNHQATTSMKGSGLGVGGFYNYAFTSRFTGYAEASLQQFNASGSTPLTDCSNSTTCDVKIMYLSFYGMGRYYLTTSKFRSWVGLGGGYLLAASKSSSVLNASQISSNQVFSFGAGGEWQLSKKNYIPFSLEYDLFPTSPSVKANMISIRAGYGWNL